MQRPATLCLTVAVVLATPWAARGSTLPEHTTVVGAVNPGGNAAERVTTVDSTYQQCTVIWSVTNSVILGALQLSTEYSASGGAFRGAAGDVECSTLTGDATAFAFNDIDDRQILNAAFISLGGIRGPVDVFRCTLDTSIGDLHVPAANDFQVTVIDSADPTFMPVLATIGVRLTCVVPCTGSAQCDDHDVCSGTEACIAGTCAAGRPLVCDDGDVCTDDVCVSPYGCDFVVNSVNHAACVPASGRMTGKGKSFFSESADVSTYAFTLSCDTSEPNNKLRIKWRRNGRKHRFKLEQMQRALCTDNPDMGTEPPVTRFDTHRGEGSGRLKIGKERRLPATVRWRFVDSVAPKIFLDVADLVVRDSSGVSYLDTPPGAYRGNHDAHAP